MSVAESDFMGRAVDLARKYRFKTAPNPCVGAVLVRDNAIIGQGAHQGHGRPHAEVLALQDAHERGIDPAGATLYVTLEPCNHFGQTPPCTEAIIRANLARVVIGTKDPNPAVAGHGAEHLAGHGLAVEIGLLEQDCRDLIADFLVWTGLERPYIIMKSASTLDGRMAERSGRSKWISGPPARDLVHALRKQVQAVLIGHGTLLADNPGLDSRRPDDENPRQQPLAVIVTGSGLPGPADGLKLLAERPDQTIFWTSEELAVSPASRALTELGCRVWGLSKRQSGLDLASGFRRLYAECGAHYVLAEGGGRLNASLLGQGLVDEWYLFMAMRLLADDQAPGLAAGPLSRRLEDSFKFRLLENRLVGEDILLRLKPLTRQDRHA